MSASGITKRMILAEDSAVTAEAIGAILRSDTSIDLVRVVNNGAAAVAAAQELRPDIVLMDVHMPGVDGFEAARRIMESCPSRVIMMSATLDPSAPASGVRAIEAGAMMIIAKPGHRGEPDYAQSVKALLRNIHLLAEVPVVRRMTRAGTVRPQRGHRVVIEVIAVGASTGGPSALKTVLSALGDDFPVPIVIVQHMTHGYISGLSSWLNEKTGLAVCVAKHGQALRPGNAYLAPDGMHIELARGPVVMLHDGDNEFGMKPAISRLFRSVADAFGARSIGVILTGMGSDGAQELRRMRDSGAVTIAEDPTSAAVRGMPEAAVRLGAAERVLALEDIGPALLAACAKNSLSV